MKLNDMACKNAKLKEKAYKLSDGHGLYLEIKPAGSKLWGCKYRYLNKEKRLSFGPYPLVTLAEAREKRDQARKLLLENIDPMAEKKAAKAKLHKEAENSFETIATEWMEMKRENWSYSHYLKTRGTLALHVFQQIGDRPIAKITAPELLNNCLRKIEKRDALDIAATTRQLCSQIFRYGIQTGRCERDVAADLRGALRTRKVNHFRTIDAKELPDFIRALERNEARLYESTRRAIWLSLYTFCRPVEIRTARWQDIDFENEVWIIPAEMMKLRRDHVVPLSRQVLTILKAQKVEQKYKNSPWVFHGQYNWTKPMSNATVSKAISLLGFGDKMVAHGFRALARTTIREQLDYDSEIIEKQLAHEASGPLRGAYDRTQFLDKRKIMMREWADFLTKVSG